MKIGIDARYANRELSEGFAVVIFNLIKNLTRIDLKNKYILYFDKPLRRDIFLNQVNFKFKVIQAPLFWTNLRLPLELMLSDKPDIFFFPAQYISWYRPFKTVVIIYDLAFLQFPQCFETKNRILLTKLTAYSAKYADKIITCSHSTKSDIIKFYKISPDKISVIYWGVDEEFTPIKDYHSIEKVKTKYNIKNYILYTGVLQPRKNLIRLIEAFNVLKNEKNLDLMLVISGKKGWFYDKIFQRVEKLKLNKDVIFTDYVSKEELQLLINGAEVFILPSLYEGFGLPLLEAMACGTPVITSNVSSMPEVVGDAGILINPYSIEEISKAINNILTDRQLRETMVNKGLERAKLFPWGNAARETLKVFEEVYRR